MTRADRHLLARQIGAVVPEHLPGIRGAVESAARPALADAYAQGRADAAADPAPAVEGHSHEAAYVPQVGAIACERRLPDGTRCPVRFRAYLPAPEKEDAFSTKGRHEWPAYDEVDVAPPDGEAMPSLIEPPSDADLGAGEEHAP